MSKVFFAAALLCAAAQAIPASAVELTPLEQRWLRAVGPVLDYSRSQDLPIDIAVREQAGPNPVPLAMGIDGGRCKLVLSLRGNPDAERQLEGVPAAQQGELIEAMAAHEVGHCWRHVRGAWHALPAGFVEVGEETADDPSLLALSKEIRETRREEGYADLVALAWTHARHPGDYARIYAWLEKLRQDQPVARGSHDTRAWVRLARDGSRFGTGGKPFDDAAPLWREGLLSDD